MGSKLSNSGYLIRMLKVCQFITFYIVDGEEQYDRMVSWIEEV